MSSAYDVFVSIIFAILTAMQFLSPDLRLSKIKVAVEPITTTTTIFTTKKKKSPKQSATKRNNDHKCSGEQRMVSLFRCENKNKRTKNKERRKHRENRRNETTKKFCRLILKCVTQIEHFTCEVKMKIPAVDDLRLFVD